MPGDKLEKGEATAAVVGIRNLQVILAQEDGQWIAQGVEIDYAAGGNSSADVKERFQMGLVATIHEHFRRFGSLEGLLAPAPASSYLHFLLGGEPHFYSQTSVHIFRQIPKEVQPILPLEKITYHEQRDAAA